jgi:hypothetical protein
MPLCWTVLHQTEWKEKVLQELPQGLAACQEEGKYMLWLGEEATVFGERGTNLALVADYAIRDILSNASL